MAQEDIILQVECPRRYPLGVWEVSGRQTSVHSEESWAVGRKVGKRGCSFSNLRVGKLPLEKEGRRGGSGVGSSENDLGKHRELSWHGGLWLIQAFMF